MTPEQQKRFDESLLHDLKLPEQPESEPLAPEDEMLEEVAEVQVEMPPDFEQEAPALVGDVMAAFEAGAGETTTQGFEGMAPEQQKLQEQNEAVDPIEKPQPIQFDEGFGEFGMMFPDEQKMLDDRNQAAAGAIPQLEEFMRDMAMDGKLDKNGFLNDNKQPPKIAPDEMEEIGQPGQEVAGAALLTAIRDQKNFQEEVIRALKALSLITQKNTATIRDITDGLLREHA